jgi:hypothetical protein
MVGTAIIRKDVHLKGPRDEATVVEPVGSIRVAGA